MISATAAVVTLLLGMLFCPVQGHAEVAFDDSSVPVQEGPVAINASDCNGDGIPDLIVANQVGNSVTILRNRGDGTLIFSKTLAATTLAPPIPTSTGPTPTPTKTASPGAPVPTPTANAAATGVSSAVCADFTGDKVADIAYVNKGSNTVTIRRKEANGDFTLLSSLPVGSLPVWVSSADLNHDNNMDLVVVDSASSDLTILLGDGNGGFPLTSTIHLPTVRQTNRPVSATLADFNGDNNIDILVASQGDPSLRLLLGDGNGTFSFSNVALPSPPRLKSVTSGKLNGDDLPDIAVLSGDTTVMFFVNDGAGSFTPFGTFAVPPNTPDIALADFDGDQVTDLALAYYKTNDVQVLLASGPATFSPPSRFSAAGQDFASSVFFNSPAAAAMRTGANGTQLVTFDKATPGLDLLDFDAANAMTTTPLTTLTAQPQALLLADFIEDGIPDAVVATKGKHGIELQILPGDSSGGYGPAATGPSTCGNGILEGGELCDDGNLKNHDGCSKTCTLEIGRKITSIAAADLNGDGHQDLVLTAANNYVWLFLGDGQGRFTETRRLTKVRTGTPASVADFTGDGIADILTIPNSGKIHGFSLLVNDGTGAFTPVPLASTLKLGGPLLAGDFDGDGLTDIVAASKDKAGGAVILYNDGTGPNANPTTINAGRSIAGLAAADFNEDGVLDIVATSSTAGKPLMLFPGMANGQYGAAQTPFVAGKGTPTILDTNQDSHQDVVLCDPTSTPPCAVQYGNGHGVFSSTFTPPAEGFIGRDLRAIAAVDLDDDGATDFVGVSRKDNQAVVLFRASATTPAAAVTLVTGNKPRAIAIGDLNGDNRPDIVVANGGSDDLSIFINLGGRQFQTLARVKLPKDALGNPGHNPSAVVIKDLDNDQKNDIIVSQEGSSNIARLKNIGGDLGNGGLASMGSLATGNDPVDMAVGDLNGDNIPDFVTANGIPGTVTVLLSNGTGYDSATLATGGVQPSAVVLGDLDAANGLDIAVINQQTNSISTFLNDSHGAFTLKKTSQARGRHNPQDLCLGDFDNDGALDVAIASPGTKDILVLRGNGDGTWASDERTYQVGKDPVSVVCTKIDTDATPDIVFGRRGSGTIDFIKTSN